MTIKELYQKARRNLLARIRRVEKRGISVDRDKVIPEQPKRVRRESVERLNKITNEKILAKSDAPKAEKVKKAGETRKVSKRTKTDEFKDAWNRETARLGRKMRTLEAEGAVRAGVNIADEFPVPGTVSPAKLKALRNITPGRLKKLFPPENTESATPVYYGRLVPKSVEAGEAGTPKRPRRQKVKGEADGAIMTGTERTDVYNEDFTGRAKPKDRVTEWLELKADLIPNRPYVVENDGVLYDTRDGSVLAEFFPGTVQRMNDNSLVNANTGKVVWKNPATENLIEANGIVYNPNTGDVTVTDKARDEYSVMPGDEGRFLVRPDGSLMDTRTWDLIHESVFTQKPKLEEQERLWYNPETDTVEKVPKWKMDEVDFIEGPRDEGPDGMNETDRMIYELMHNPDIPHDYARIQELIKRVKSHPDRDPAESYEDYLARLIIHVRTRAYQDELGNYPERGDMESREEYLKRLALLVEESGRPTLTGMEERKRNVITDTLEKRLGYNPFKPVTDEDRVSVDTVLEYILEHWDTLKGNLPHRFSYYGKPEETNIRLALEKMDERSLRNFYYARVKAVEREEERNRKYTPVDELPPMTMEDAIDERFKDLVDKFTGSDIEEQARGLENKWEKVKKEHGDKLGEYLDAHGNELVEELDNMIPEWWQYYVNDVESGLGMFTLPDKGIERILSAGRLLSLNEVRKKGDVA